MAGCPRLVVPAPTVQRYGAGLFAAAIMPPAPAEDIWQCGVEYWTAACAEASTWTDNCEDPPDPKEPAAVRSKVVGTPFVVYAGPTCNLVGNSLETIRQSAVDALELGEQRAVEQAFWSGELGNTPSLAGGCCTDPPDPNDPTADDTCCRNGTPCCTILNPTDTPTAADALSVTAGVAALEDWAGAHYSGEAIIHATRGMAAFASASRQLEGPVGGLKRTPLGTRWAFYGGSPNTGPCGQPAPEGTAWMYVTGSVRIYRSDVFTTPTAGQLAEGASLRTNQATVLAERIYVLTRECICAAVLVSASCQC